MSLPLAVVAGEAQALLSFVAVDHVHFLPNQAFPARKIEM